MPVETLHPADARLGGASFTSAMPFRILNKGPDYFRRPAEAGARKPSAVERLEADKAKYVKSQQVALTRQAPIKAPIIRKPLVPAGVMFQISTPPARKAPRGPSDVENGGAREGPGGRRGPTLNLDVLNNLINDVRDGPQGPGAGSRRLGAQGPGSGSSSSTSPSSSSPSSGAKSISSSLSGQRARHGDHLPPPTRGAAPSSSTSSSASSPPHNHLHAPGGDMTRRPPPVPARAPRAGAPAPYGSPNSVTVRRVDVRPQTEVRTPRRNPLQPRPRPRQTAQGQVAHPQAPPPQPPPKQPHPQLNAPAPPAYVPPSPMLVRGGVLPPASPAFTRISNASSKGSGRKHPSLHRSKSDLSDRYSRATADMERFFNYCGLAPEEVEGLGGVERFTRANSDIVSVSKLRSVSTPSSEAERGRGRGDDDDDDGGGDRGEDEPGAAGGDRVPYGISVIERNARVIKWLYGIRQARDANGAVSNV
ncbi:protein FAM110A [Antennarius striatus]|uniref:protein FAM110A n=1 Tax=Antennarius striatus TaxID=241820 RepID=UPI0035B430FD